MTTTTAGTVTTRTPEQQAAWERVMGDATTVAAQQNTTVSTYADIMGRRHARITRGALSSILITREPRDMWRVWYGDSTRTEYIGSFRQAVRHARQMIKRTSR